MNKVDEQKFFNSAHQKKITFFKQERNKISYTVCEV